MRKSSDLIVNLRQISTSTSTSVIRLAWETIRLHEVILPVGLDRWYNIYGPSGRGGKVVDSIFMSI